MYRVKGQNKVRCIVLQCKRQEKQKQKRAFLITLIIKRHLFIKIILFREQVVYIDFVFILIR